MDTFMEFEMGFDTDRRVKADRPPKDKPSKRAGNAPSGRELTG
jgi:hypothetical protein